jgi:guanosine-3',5'-bis(diphosphate) 3'-pyrophosphohydrolase
LHREGCWFETSRIHFMENTMTSFTLDTVYWASVWAKEAHGDQEYGDGLPYVTHLDDVRDVLEEYGIFSLDMWVAAYLHDIVEDTTVTIEEVEARFGPFVADTVSRVTNPTGGNRAERHAIAYPRIRESVHATMLKLADRIANVRSGGKTGMYRKEHPRFKEMLYRNDFGQTVESMWLELEKLLT